MSIETDIRAALVGHAPLVALVGQRVALSAIEQGQPAPYVVFTTSHDPQYGLDGTLLGNITTVEIQCWADTAVQAAAVADAASNALSIQGAPPTARGTGYDPEVGLDAVTLTTDWITS